MFNKIKIAYKYGWVDEAYLLRAVAANVITAKQKTEIMNQ